MEGELLLWLALCVTAAAALYSSVGHGGASAYIALMTLFGLAPAEVRPAALVLNIIRPLRLARLLAVCRHRYSRSVPCGPD